MVNKESPRTMNPLWIISLFLGLSEVTVGVVATQSTGWVQGLLAIFSVAYPIGTAVVFFFILWYKPYVLYAPRDYSKDTNVSAFVEAMTKTVNRRNQEIESVVRSTVEAVVKTTAPTEATEQQIDADVKLAVQVARDSFEQMQVYIDATEVPKHVNLASNVFGILVSDGMTVQEFMDELWSKLYPAFEPYTYGEHWTLEDREGRRFNSVVPAQRRRKLPNADDRDLRQAGVKPGDHLRVVVLPGYRPTW